MQISKQGSVYTLFGYKLLEYVEQKRLQYF